MVSKLVKIILICCIFTSCSRGLYTYRPVISISISSDGRYVLSAHYSNYLTLWDIEKRSVVIISSDASLYSAYFIPNSNKYIWQEKSNNIVHIESVNGDNILSINPGFEVYGNFINNDLKNYFAFDRDMNLYNIDNKSIKSLVKKGISEYARIGKISTTSIEKNLLLTAGYTNFYGEGFPLNVGSTQRDINPKIPERVDSSLLRGLVLWDIEQKKPLMKFLSLSAKTVGSISPDGNYVVGGDENIGLRVWEIKTGKKLGSEEFPNLYDPTCGVSKDVNSKYCVRMAPADYDEHPWVNGTRTVAVKFIDEQGDFIRFGYAVNYGILYNVNSTKILAYMNLGKNPQPDTFSFTESPNLIATAPKAKILVTAATDYNLSYSGDGSGIIVYKFNEKTRELERIWAPDLPIIVAK